MPFPIIPDHDDKSSVSIMGPGNTQFLYEDLKMSLTPAHIEQFVSEALVIHAVGRISYVDAFKEPRFTEFNFFFGGSYGANENGAMYSGTTGNNAT